MHHYSLPERTPVDAGLLTPWRCRRGWRRSGALLRTVDLFGDGVGGVVVQLPDDALVGVAGQGGAGVAELLLDDLDVDAGGQGEGGGAVAQVMQPDRGQPGPL